MSAIDDKRGPGLVFPPPLLPLVAMGASWGLQRWYPLRIVGDDGLWWPGVLLFSVAILLALITLLQFLRAKTHVEPWQPTTTVIQTGVFRYSRNPIYLCFCIATFAFALVIDSWWAIAALPALVFLLYRLVIRKEEAYLAHKFGESYLDYRKRVRRWL